MLDVLNLAPSIATLTAIMWMVKTQALPLPSFH
jgi:hypothetical protein